MLTRIFDALNKVVSNPKINKLISQVSMTSAENLSPVRTDEIHKRTGTVIAEAKHEVCMQFYKFFGDSDGGKEIITGIRQLQKKAMEARKPVTVNVLLNARGGVAEKFYKPNNPTGLEKLVKELNNQFFTLRVAYHPTKAFGTFHTKMILADGSTAVLCSGDPSSPNDYKKHQFESATVITGKAVDEMHKDFAQSWQRFYKSENEKMEVTVKDKTSPGKDKESKVASSESKIPTTPCIFISKKENGNPFSVKYKGCVSPYKIALLEAINTAKQSIKIMTPNFNDPDICEALANACNRGIKVQIITGKHHNDKVEKYWGGTNFKTMSLLVNKIEDKHHKNLMIKWATNSKGAIVEHGEHYTIHGKFACIDDVVFVGSTPLDKQGICYSREADLIFEDSEQAKKFTAEIFQEKFSQGKDYFSDCFDELLNKINEQTKRLAQSEEVASNHKARTLQAALKKLHSVFNDPTIQNDEKPKFLLAGLLPILSKHTDIGLCNTTSYNEVITIVEKYGLRIADIKIYMERLKQMKFESKDDKQAQNSTSADLSITLGVNLTVPREKEQNPKTQKENASQGSDLGMELQSLKSSNSIDPNEGEKSKGNHLKFPR